MRAPVNEDFAGGYPSDEEWHGTDTLIMMRRVLLKVHGAFAGYSGVTLGICNAHYVHFPIPEVLLQPRTVDPNICMWHRCLTSTGQPDFVQV